MNKKNFTPSKKKLKGQLIIVTCNLKEIKTFLN